MAKRRFLKRMAAVASAVAMLMGLSLNVFASDSDYNIGTIEGGMVFSRIDCDYDQGTGYAETLTRADYEVDNIYAYVWLELYGVTGGGYYEFLDEDTDESNVPSVAVMAKLTLYDKYGIYVGLSATSYHVGYINIENNNCSCGLSADN